MQHRIKVVLIDIDNTLLDFIKCAEYSMKKAFSDWNLEYKPEYLEVFLEENNYFWSLFEDGIIERDEIFKRRFKTVFERLGIEIDGEAFERTYLKYMYESHEKIPGAKELLEYLSNKYDLYVASNAIYEEQASRLKEAGLFDYFRELYTSEDIGFAKPDEKFFDYIRKDIGDLEKDEILMIGDSLKADISGGKDYGIRTLWYNGRGEAESDIPDYTVRSLDEIREIL